MTPNPLAGFPISISADVAWAEMDAFQHLNNTVYFRYFENARIEYMRKIGWFESMETKKIGPIVASTQARFRKPVKFPDRISIAARIISIEMDRVTFEHRIISGNEIAADGQAVVVNYDYANGKKAALGDDLRDAIQKLEST